MNKLTEILQEIIDPHNPIMSIKGYDQVVEAMKRYAEYYAKQVLELAAKSATVTIGNDSVVDEDGDLCEHTTFIVNPFSITYIKLPDHNEI